MTDQDIRLPLLQQLAEQAMTDADFRAVARGDLDAALTQYGYDLNETELALVHKFRAALEEAGVDLFLARVGELDLEQGLTSESAARLEKLLAGDA